MQHVEIAIVGGGIVGLTLAAALKNSDLNLAIIDKTPCYQALSDKPTARVSAINQANIKALETSSENYNTIYNVACGEKTTLNELVKYINDLEGQNIYPVFVDEREGDVRHSLADISKAEEVLNYHPKFHIKEGLKHTIKWYKSNGG